MNLNNLKTFAQNARRKLMSEVSTRLDYVLGHDDAYIRSRQSDIAEINRRLAKESREQLVEEAAYTWFNRIVALRYMDLRGYNKVRVVSPRAGQVQPELLFQIKQGRTPKELQGQQSVFDGYLNGTVMSDQPDREIYSTALLGICNDYSRTLPFLFRQVDAYMAVLLPTDLLSESSILSAVQGAIGEEDVADVEVIGWLYQFYISEKKDQVFGRPKGQKIGKEDIPAATQLFTPHWIVRYMVENSLGRLWRNNRPDTVLAERMEYYIEGDPEPEYLTIEGPEEITLLDPACGSGHILTYAFDLLYGMYEEAGYSAEEIPSLILNNNLYGIDIDTRAAELASFALTMKAREKDRFFFGRGVVPRVVAMEDVSVDLREAGITMSPQLQEAFGYLTEATNFGSLIPVPAEVQGEIEDILAELDAKGDADLFADQAMAQVRSGLRQLGYLARRYHCVVTNPPYKHRNELNESLYAFLETYYSEKNRDLYSSFMVRFAGLLMREGYGGIVTRENWLFTSRFDRFREWLLDSMAIEQLLHIGAAGFDSISGEVVRTVSAILRLSKVLSRSTCISVTEGKTEGEKAETLTSCPNLFIRDLRRYQTIEGAPLVYWMPDLLLTRFEQDSIGSHYEVRAGLTTGSNDDFLREWWACGFETCKFDAQSAESLWVENKKWIPIRKGSSFRKWYGVTTELIRFDRVSYNELANSGNHLASRKWYFRPAISWNDISSSGFGIRYAPQGGVFTTAAYSVLSQDANRLPIVLAFLGSKVASYALSFLNPTLHSNPGDVRRLPWIETLENSSIIERVLLAIQLSKHDWDSRETSWDFKRSPLLTDYSVDPTHIPYDTNITERMWPSSVGETLSLSNLSTMYRAHWTEVFRKLHCIEEENNRDFIKLYGLDGVMTPEVSYTDITILRQELVANSRERGEIEFNEEEIFKQFISYGVGCIFGRYSLDKDGLVLGNAGDDFEAYLSQIPQPALRPDESGILPITDDNDFADDLPTQWRTFLRAAFGDQHYEENLRFLEDGLGKRLRQYFLKGFYDDHVKRYKKRPIYWLITSPRGTLQALIYLHRYNRDTVNRFLNDYLRPYQQKLEAKRVSAEHVLTGGGSSQGEKTKAQKRIDEIRKALEELSTWERDVVRPLAEKRIELDLDDGVKVNYGKLGAILAKVKGLNA